MTGNEPGATEGEHGMSRRQLMRHAAWFGSAVVLTVAGERTFEELFPRFNTEESQACGGLDAEGRTQLAALLRTLVTTIRGGM